MHDESAETVLRCSPERPRTQLALITGAGVRVGRAIALELARGGFDLILHAHRSTAALQEVAEEVARFGRRAYLESADLSSPGQVDELAERVRIRFPVIDALIHNAGIFERVPFPEISRAAYRRMQEINLEAPFFLSQALLPNLEASEAPCIIHISDIAGDRPYSHYAHYSISKAGLMMLTRALAAELAPRIRVNAVAPGAVAFPEDFSAEARARILERVPLGREGSVEDVARAVLFLVRDAPYVTGQILAVDGGRSCRL